MATFLFDKIVFGPVFSRRLGISLGINLLPNDCKVCNFNCIYCECGITPHFNLKNINFHKRENIFKALENKLIYLKKNNEVINTITFAGNGEPTLHPYFPEIIDDTIKLRNVYSPKINIAVLSNSTTIYNKKIFTALKKIDKNILKFDSAYKKTIEILNNPPKSFNIYQTIENLKKFNGQLIIQTLFIEGKHKGKIISNATDREIEAWLRLIKEIKPKEIMIYTIERDTPYPGLNKIPIEKLSEIAKKAEDLGFKIHISK